jgi:hypothetical protein
MTLGGVVASVETTPPSPRPECHMTPLNPVTAVLDRVRAWSVASQQGARRNAMVANTALAARRAERQDVDAYFAALRPKPRLPTAVHR